MEHSVEVLHKSSKLRRRPPAGSVPGTFVIPDDALKPRILIHSFTKDVYVKNEMQSVADIQQHFDKHPDCQHWIDIQGIGDQKILLDLSEMFKIHKLVLADVVNVNQRPKIEEYPDYIFVVSRMMYRDADDDLFNEQVSIFLGSNYVISIQENYGSFFLPVLERLVSGKGYIRGSKVDFLAYAMVDALLDNYFPLLERTGDELEQLEHQLIAGIPKKKMMLDIQGFKRELVVIRRTAWQNRDMINDMMRSTTKLISENTRLFLRDAVDHNIQVIDIVDGYKETTSSLMELYLSSANIRLNQIMKVLAMVSAAFIPPTFVVGVYGMNFHHYNEVTGDEYFWNMPELYSPYGYVMVMGAMFLTLLGFGIYFVSKGWFEKD